MLTHTHILPPHQYGGECYGCAGCAYAAQGVASGCSAPLGCASVNQVYTFAPSLVTTTWAFAGMFSDHAGGARTMPQSGNQRSYGAACFPNPAACYLVDPTTLAACQQWASVNGLNTVGIQARASFWAVWSSLLFF